MLKKLQKENMGKSNLGWLESRFHFSFADYRNPKNINFGVLRVLNDDIIHPSSGFDTHSHANMEIISYVIDGEITHKDSMGNSETLKRGEVQYLSAGNGIFHSEHNINKEKDLRLLQIWIFPPKDGLPTLYGSERYTIDDRYNKLLNIVSSEQGNSKIKLYQDANIFVSEFDRSLKYNIEKKRQVYFVQIEGKTNVNGIELNHGDAMEIFNEDTLNIEPITKSHILFIDMKQTGI